VTRRRVPQDVRQKVRLGSEHQPCRTSVVLPLSCGFTVVVLHRRVLDDKLRVLVVASEITTCRRPGKITVRQCSLGDVFCREAES
jgi:hypothetical protein